MKDAVVLELVRCGRLQEFCHLKRVYAAAVAHWALIADSVRRLGKEKEITAHLQQSSLNFRCVMEVILNEVVSKLISTEGIKNVGQTLGFRKALFEEFG